MTKHLLLLWFCFFILVTLDAQELYPVVNGGYSDLPFEKYVEILEKEKGIRTYYKKEWVENVLINVVNEQISLNHLLAGNLNKHNLTFSFIPPDRLYILQNSKLSTALPDYVISRNEDLRTMDEVKLSESEERYLQGRKSDAVENIIIGSKSSFFSKKPATIKGRIVNKETGEPVIGATMVITETGKGSITNENGIVTLVVYPGEYIVSFSYVGLRNKNAKIEVYESGSFNLEMDPEVVALTEVQIVGNEHRKIKGTEMGLERINVNSIKQIPILLGEKDIIKVSQLLPGIVSVSEASSGLYVRGGNADQNVFYIEDVPLYNTSHSFGFFSAFNSDIIREFLIYKGNIPAQYGGRLSSVFDISARRGNLKKFSFHGGISPISAYLTLEGPLKRDRGSILISGRTSYSDWLLRRIEDPTIRNSNATFYDISSTFYYKLGDKDDINLFLYNSSDTVDLYSLKKYSYQNQGGSIKWTHQFLPAFRSELSFVKSLYQFNTQNISLPSLAYKHYYRIGHNELKLNFNLFLGLRHEIKFGGNAILYPLDRGTIEPLEGSFKRPVKLGEENGLQSALYISDKMTLTRWLTIYAGYRYNYYSYLGPADVNQYYENSEKKEENISEVISYKTYEPVVNYSRPSIRAGLSIKPFKNTSLKFSYSEMNQYLFMASNSISIAPDDQWKLADVHLKPQSSYQYSAGIYQYFPKKDITFSVEAYRKENANILEYKDGADFINNPYPEMSILQGNQFIEGVEFMLEKKSGQLDGWLSYTYSSSMITVDGENPWDQINNGNPYPSNYDKPHVFNFVGTYRTNRAIAVSSSVVYSTGRPVTLAESLYYIDDQPFISFYDRNSKRLTDYFRADFSLTIEGNLKRKKPIHSSWIFSVYNITGRNNVQSIFFRSEEGKIQGYELSIIGIPILTLTWSVKLGNYAAN